MCKIGNLDFKVSFNLGLSRGRICPNSNPTDLLAVQTSLTEQLKSSISDQTVQILGSTFLAKLCEVFERFWAFGISSKYQPNLNKSLADQLIDLIVSE